MKSKEAQFALQVTLGSLLLVAVFFFVTKLPRTAPRAEPEVRWLGAVTYTTKYQRLVGETPVWPTPTGNLVFDDEVEIGLRSDGVVVWRKVNK